jgi:TP901 family phage tail tape measure protein
MADVRLNIYIRAYDQAKGVLAGLGDELGPVNKQIDEMNGTWGKAMQVGQQAGMALTAAGASVAVGMGMAYNAAAQFDQGMRNVNSIAQLSEQEFARLTESVKGIASDRRVVDSPKVLADGLYDIYSSGLQGAQALEALEVASKGASAGQTDTATAANVLVAAMNAYGQKGPGDAARIMDTLFKTVDRGVVSFPQLANVLGNVMGTAAQVGVPLHDVGAAIATMTKQGIGAEESVTSLNAILMQFLSPSEAFAASIKAAGYESGLAVIQAKGLAGAIQFLADSTGGNQAQMAQMLGEVRAVRGAMALTGKGADMFAEDQVGVADAVDATGRALEEQSKGALFRQRVALKQLGLAAINAGGVLKDAVAAAAPALTGLLSVLTDLAATPIGQAMVVAAGGFSVAALAAGPLLMALPGIVQGYQMVQALIQKGRAAWAAHTAAMAADQVAATAAAAANKAAAIAAAGGDMGKYVGGVAGGTFGMTTAKQAASRAATTIAPEIAATGAKAGAGFVASLTGVVSAALPLALPAAVAAAIAGIGLSWATAGSRAGKALSKSIADGTIDDDSAIAAMREKLADMFAEAEDSLPDARKAGEDVGKAFAGGFAEGQGDASDLIGKRRSRIGTLREEREAAVSAFGAGSRQAIEAENRLLEEQSRLQIDAIAASQARMKSSGGWHTPQTAANEAEIQREAQRAFVEAQKQIDRNREALAALGTAAETTGAAIAQATEQTKEQAKASEDAADAADSHAKAQRDTARSVADAAEAVVNADEAIVDAEAAKVEAIQQGAERVQDALSRLTDAQEKYADAVEDAAEREQDAIERVADAREKADEALLTGRERAVAQLERAQEKLFDLTATPEEKKAREEEQKRTEAERARAELAKAQAELAAFDRQIAGQGIQERAPEFEADKIAREGAKSVLDAETALAKTRISNAKAIADANNAVVAAEKAVADAVRETQKAVEDAADRVTEAYEARTKAVQAHADAVLDANDRMAKSYRALEDAVLDANDRMAKSYRELEDAQQKAGLDVKPTGGAAAKPAGRPSIIQHAVARATGGPVFSGLPYIVGERGPELFLPQSGGQIMPDFARMTDKALASWETQQHGASDSAVEAWDNEMGRRGWQASGGGQIMQPQHLMGQSYGRGAVTHGAGANVVQQVIAGTAASAGAGNVLGEIIVTLDGDLVVQRVASRADEVLLSPKGRQAARIQYRDMKGRE